MGLLSNLNILVDDFYYGPSRESYNYIYFLSHMHSDHYQGLSNDWDYGPIYCSHLTKQVLLNKFPLLKVTGLEMNKEYEIFLNKSKTIKYTVTLLDANHIAGSVMFLFQGDMGTFFHTGDFRFDEFMFEQFKTLYPNGLGFRKDGIPKSIQIDELILDNTYCDPVFKFPKRKECVKGIKKIIKENMPCDVYISTYNLGKEEILVELSEYFKTKIVVTEERYRDVIALGFSVQNFSTNEDDGWIYCKKWKDKSINEEIKEGGDKNAIKITPTGWANIKEIICMRENEYIVPYSSHSNYNEMEKFVCSISPSVLKCVVREKKSNYRKIGGNSTGLGSGYMFTLQSLKQKGYDLLVKKYCNIETASKRYLKFMKVEEKDNLMKELGLVLNHGEKKQRNTKIFEKKHQRVFKARNRNKFKKGIKFKKPELNDNLGAEDLMVIKKWKEEKSQAENMRKTQVPGEEKIGNFEEEKKEKISNVLDDSFDDIQKELKRGKPNNNE